MDDISHLILFAKSLAIGLLIGVERERHAGAKAGLRTFGLIALSGTLFAYLGEQINAPWIIVIVAAVVGCSMIAAYSRNQDPQADSGTTTVIAALITFALGALLWFGHANVAITLAITTMALLYFRTELHSATKHLSPRDYVSFLQFAVLAFILLPILPDRTFDPFGVLNPYRLVWMVVLISGVSLSGYVALRLFGAQRGLLVAGVFGGLASTTATTLAFSRRARSEPTLTALAGSAVIVANLVLYFRIGVFALLIAPKVLPQLLPVLIGGVAGGGLYFLWMHHQREKNVEAQTFSFEIENPTELRAALTFAALFAVVSVLVAWMNTIIGVAGIYLAAFVSGLTDLDAIALSTLRMINTFAMKPSQVAIAISIAIFANFIFKFGIAILMGSVRLARAVGFGFLSMALGMSIGITPVILHVFGAAN